MDADVKTMTDCYLECTKTIQHCLEKGGKHAAPEHLNLLMDCAKICNLASDFACRGSANHKALCELCADICKQCADECESMAEDDDVMQACADACRKCAEVCERMAR